MPNPSSSPFSKTLKFSAFLGLVALVILFSAYFIRHYYYLHNLNRYDYFTKKDYQEPIFPKLTQKQILNLGWAHIDPETWKSTDLRSPPPKTSYTKFQESKDPDIIRIGIFGDSFVHGLEAAYGQDFPTLLQELFNQSGEHRVEVLNFGMSGYGIHQSFLLWEYLGEKFEIDYPIFFPFYFHIDRDRTFNRHLNQFCPMHARYIVTQDNVELVSVLGDSREEACGLYHSLFTPWQYVRYDQNAPPFLRVLVPTGRNFKFNPFYYSNLERKQEALTSYERLFNKLANQSTHPIVVCNHPDICDLRTKVSNDVVFYDSQIGKYFKQFPSLYRAPQFHLSALGNELRAQELFSFLTGNPQPGLQVMTVSSTSAFPRNHFESLPPLHQFDEVRIGINSQVASDFVVHAQGQSAWWKFNADLPFKEKKISSLLWGYGEKGLKFIPTTFPLKNTEKVYVSFNLHDDPIRLPIGQIEAGHSLVGKLSLICGSGINFSANGQGTLTCDQNYLRSIHIEGMGIPQNVTIELGEHGRTIMKGDRLPTIQSLKSTWKDLVNVKQATTVQLKPVIASVATLRAKAGTLTLREDAVPESGTLDLMLTGENGEKRSYPITRYHRETVKIPEPESPNEFPIQVNSSTSKRK